jgi:hypothetical protein
MPSRKIQNGPARTGLANRAAQSLRYLLTGSAPEAWFGPSEPPVAQAPQSRARLFDYMPGLNLASRPRQEPQGGISFEQLRGLADGYDLLRLVIETRKDQIARLDWTIRPRGRGVSAADPRLAQAAALFQYPDREHDWAGWLRMLVEDLLVIDAPCLYPRRTLGGDLYALEVVDGATIKRVLDQRGRTPEPPDPAYQQVLHGVPASDYTRDELLYLPRNIRSHKVYGCSPVEQVVMTVNIALRRQMSQLAYYTEGNVPEALIGVPETWSPDQIGQFQLYWDALLEGDAGARRHARFVPATISKSFVQTREAALKDDYDDWLARIVCYAFSVSYQALTKEVNRATADSARLQAHQEGLAPLAQWVKGMMDRILSQVLGWPDLEFAWAAEADLDPLTQAQISQIYLSAGVMTVEEVRAGLGLPAAPAAKLGKFNPYHDAVGRFTFAGAAAGVAATVGTVAGRVGAAAIGAGSAAAAGVAAGATVFLYPGNAGQAQDGILSGNPDVSYRVAEGQLTLTRADADGNKVVVFDGVPGFDGVYRTKDGTVIARQVGNGVEVNEGAVANLKSKTVEFPAISPNNTAGDAKNSEEKAGRTNSSGKAQEENSASDAESKKKELTPLPKNPDDLLGQGFVETTTPGAAATGHRKFENPNTGEKINWDKGQPGEPGHKGRDHYHRLNPNSTGKKDYYLDNDGNVVPKNSNPSHLYP